MAFAFSGEASGCFAWTEILGAPIAKPNAKAIKATLDFIAPELNVKPMGNAIDAIPFGIFRVAWNLQSLPWRLSGFPNAPRS
ncbi:hypothetical protein [Synechococcus sp. CBW1107]|uniref:hypothetical protein n=1 Tax=Synechococcus sp. CBW1107 TaxID=2789857 RepID=UPI002AD235D3|nr:hypothetical protein [Synechococcus sp. CBW1107]